MKKILLFAAMALVTLSASAQKLGRVNYTELVQLTPEADEARATLSAAQKEAEETLSAMVEEFQTKYSQYEQKSSTWTAAIKASKEKELGDIQNRIQEFQQSVSQELQQKQNQLWAPIYEKAQNTVTTLAKNQGVVAVFDSGSALYFDENAVVDLTPAARRALNIPADRTLESLQAELQAQAQAGM